MTVMATLMFIWWGTSTIDKTDFSSRTDCDKAKAVIIKHSCGETEEFECLKNIHVDIICVPR